MATATRWVNVTIQMQSALGANKTISAITTASPGVVSSTSHGISDGAYVVYTMTSGMPQLNERVLRIDNPATSAWDIEGVDTSGYDAFVSGYANEVTFGTTFQTLMEITGEGGEMQYGTYRLLNENQERRYPTFRSPRGFQLRSLWDPADSALVAAEVADNAGTARAVKITFSNGKIWVFNGLVDFSGAPSGTELVECTIGFSGQGRGKFYAS